MVYNYVKKTNRQEWDEDAMKKAITAVREGKFKIRAASKTFDVPYSSLQRRIKSNSSEKKKVRI